MKLDKNSPSALFFLATFALPRNPEEYPLLSREQWAHLLGSDPETFTAELLDAGLLETAPLGAQLHFRFSRGDLSRFCQDLGLSPSGVKRDLVLRLVTHDPVGMKSQLRGPALIQYSKDGRDAVERKTKTTAAFPFGLTPNFRSLATVAGQGIIGNAAFVTASQLLKESKKHTEAMTN